MSITPQYLDELRSRVPISELVGRFVSWDQRKSSPAKGDFWAPCPFHSEKTASFHVQDPKGFYYCFGCHAKGDAIGFLKDHSNMSFVEAVRELSAMAGMEMPAHSPEAKAKTDANARLIEMHETAARFFTLQLSSAAGAQARDYLYQKRGLSTAIVQEFGIGLVPNARDTLTQHLRDAGYHDAELIEGGLSLKPDDGGTIFDRFRDRIMFPIHDPRGRVVAFGGRAMNANARAKYLNSAESPIFHKGRQLYNLHRARNHVKGDQHLIIAEGYMDVIALAQAGFPSAIAPLGTAVTDEQLDVIWRIDPLPSIALDGDAAGVNAANRLANLAIPKLASERSLKFATLPAGQDPDDLIQSGGVQAMKNCLDAAEPMVSQLWKMALGNDELNTPEARAGLDARLKAMVNMIGDTNLRNHYFAEFRERRKGLFAPNRTASAPNVKPPKMATQKLGQGYVQSLRVALYLRAILAQPASAKRYSELLVNLTCPLPDLERLRKEVIMAHGDVDAITLLATPENIALTGINNLLRSLSENDYQNNDWVEILDNEEGRLRILNQTEAELSDIRDKCRKGEYDEHVDKILRETVLMREEAAILFDDNEGDDDEKRAFLHQFLESEGWRK